MSRPIIIKIKRLNPAATLPLRMTEHAAGYDVSACLEKNMRLKRGEIQLIPTGFAMALPHGYEAQMRPRSGLASKHGVTMVNTPGTIDSDYRGEVKVAVINLGKKSFTVENGMRIAQMLIAPVPKTIMREVKDLDETRRGKGGFGHTGS